MVFEFSNFVFPLAFGQNDLLALSLRHQRLTCPDEAVILRLKQTKATRHSLYLSELSELGG